MLTVCRCQQLAGDWRTQVQAYVRAQQWDSAIALVNGELTRGPQDPELLAWRARLLLWAGKLDEAALEWKHVLAVAPDIRIIGWHWPQFTGDRVIRNRC